LYSEDSKIFHFISGPILATVADSKIFAISSGVSVLNPRLSNNSFAPLPASYHNGPLNSLYLFSPIALFKAFAIEVYEPVNA